MVNLGHQSTFAQIRRITKKIFEMEELGISPQEVQDRLKISRDRYFSYRKKYKEKVLAKHHYDPIIATLKPLKKIDKTLNPIEFCEKYLAIKPLKMQNLILKAFYNLPLSEWDKTTLLKLKRAGKTTWEEGGEYEELVLMIGMKGGKTVTASLIAQIEEYELFKIGDISRHYGFVPGQRIYIKNVATNSEQAEKTIFAQIQASIDRSPYFKARNPDLAGSIYHFKDTNVYIESGHSNSSSLVGDACKLVLLDELDRFKTSSGRSSAEAVYSALDKSTDPFGKEGKKVSISSLVNNKGFMVSLYEKCTYINSMLGFWMAEWEMQPERYSGKIFSVRGIKIPLEHTNAYKKNPGKFLRDKACIFGYTKGAYYREPERVKHVFEQSHNEGYKNPVDEQGILAEWFHAKEDYEYFEHHDPSSNHDAYAIALAHREGFNGIIDMVHRFTPPEEGGEIDLDEVEKFCKLLHTRFPNPKVTYDTWQAALIMQHFKKIGIEVEHLYVRIIQHDLMKEKIYSNEFRSHRYPVLEREILNLEQTGNDVDHPPNGSKDTSDAVAGVLWGMFKSYTGLDAGMAVKKNKDNSVRSGFKTLDFGRRQRIWERP